MELATLGRDAEASLRIARPDDAPAITRLLQRSPYTHYHVDWYAPVDWLGNDGFVVLPGTSANEAQSVLGRTDTLQACLAVAADPLPSAWIRVAAVAKSMANPEGVLADMLQAVTPYLQETAVSELACLPVQQWLSDWLPHLGFRQANELETYVKQDLTGVPAVQPPEITIRAVADGDYPHLEAIEALAFAPIWRYSARSLMAARQQVFSFDVAEWDGVLVGYQLSMYAQYETAHLVRLTIDPRMQGLGVGTALLGHALAGYQQRGITAVSLNTQVDNEVSKRLYHKFGFIPGNHRMPVWVRPITLD